MLWRRDHAKQQRQHRRSHRQNARVQVDEQPRPMTKGTAANWARTAPQMSLRFQDRDEPVPIAYPIDAFRLTRPPRRIGYTDCGGVSAGHAASG